MIEKKQKPWRPAKKPDLYSDEELKATPLWVKMRKEVVSPDNPNTSLLTDDDLMPMMRRLVEALWSGDTVETWSKKFGQ
jgi:hypothetical protein